MTGPSQARPGVIAKSDAARRAAAIPDLEAYRAAFTWEAARRELSGLPDGRGLNLAHEAVDRHASGTAGARTAIRWIGRDHCRRDLTYAELAEATSRFANALARLGLGAGDPVFLLLGRVPELHLTALGALKHRCVVSPLFAAFGPEPLRTRLELGEARLLVTTPSLYRRKVEPFRAHLSALEYVVLVPEPDDPGHDLSALRLGELLDQAAPWYRIEPTDPETPALLHFTSGTTGQPKGALHVHEAVVMHHLTGRVALDFRPGDVFWCTADPGWVTGTSYGIVAPLTHGLTLVLDEAEFDAERWYRILAEERVSVWYTAPTAVRMMMRAGLDLARERPLPALRFIASVGEPLGPDAVCWGLDAFGLPIHDNWWQTETGGIMIANYPAMDIRPGSMGQPMPGVEAGIVRRLDDGSVEEVTVPGEQGELALRSGWPSMFRGYLKAPERYARCFAGGWYLTGDLARRDSEGYYWFVGRSDDVIKSAGHLIGPFEVESALVEHPDVVEAAVIGKPDPVVGEIVKAFVALRPGVADTESTRRALLAHARTRLGAAVAPREIQVVPSLPRTRSGKILRRLLKARELGLPEGDLSTLEPVS